MQRLQRGVLDREGIGMGETADLGDRGGVVAASAVASRQASALSTRADGDYLKWRINIILAALISPEWLVERWVQWKRERDEFRLLSEIGLGNPASASLAEDLNALLVLCDSEIRRVKGVVGPRRAGK